MGKRILYAMEKLEKTCCLGVKCTHPVVVPRLVLKILIFRLGYPVKPPLRGKVQGVGKRE